MTHLLKFDSLESTNQYCEILDHTQLEDFTVVWALRQTAGIGQRGNHWESGSSAENLTFSLILKPTALAAASQFHLTEALSLAVADWLEPLVEPLHTVRIKWPNDIYVDHRKICGMLISNRLSGGMVTSAVCGIGVNINKTTFGTTAPNGTSLRLLTATAYSEAQLQSQLQSLLACIATRYAQLNADTPLHAQYLDRLYLRLQPATFIHNGTPVTATILDTDSFGHLLLLTADGRHLRCGLKEISFPQK